MYIFFDTETTGVPRNWNAPLTQLSNWPRMVQIAWMRFDESGQALEEHDCIIYPENYTIPISVTRVHGISTAKAKAEGQDLTKVLEHFAESVRQSELVVAHNISFDEKIVGAEFLRKNVVNDLYQKRTFCTMKNTTHITKIRNRYGYKWPSLSELHTYLFGEAFDNQHNALADIQATARCYWELKRRGLI